MRSDSSESNASQKGCRTLRSSSQNTEKEDGKKQQRVRSKKENLPKRNEFGSDVEQVNIKENVKIMRQDPSIGKDVHRERDTFVKTGKEMYIEHSKSRDMRKRLEKNEGRNKGSMGISATFSKYEEEHDNYYRRKQQKEQHRITRKLDNEQSKLSSLKTKIGMINEREAHKRNSEAKGTSKNPYSSHESRLADIKRVIEEESSCTNKTLDYETLWKQEKERQALEEVQRYIEDEDTAFYEEYLSQRRCQNQNKLKNSNCAERKEVEAIDSILDESKHLDAIFGGDGRTVTCEKIGTKVSPDKSAFDSNKNILAEAQMMTTNTWKIRRKMAR